MSPLLTVRGLTVEFPRPDHSARFVPAISDLSFEIAGGGVLGLVGESGSGKSVTSLALMRLLPPQARVGGEIIFDGQNILTSSEETVRQIRGSQMAMIFQEPMTALNPVMRVGEQIAEAVRAHDGVTKKESWDRAVEAMNDVAIADAGRRARDYPHQLSGGMRQRVMIAMAIVNRPRLLIADEPTTALDVTVQAQTLELLSNLRSRFGLTMLFISHDLAVVSQIADHVGVMYAGRMVEMGSKQDIFRVAAHPYTRGLLNAVPTLNTDRGEPMRTIEGTVPSGVSDFTGCGFEPRCDFRISECSRIPPPLVEIRSGHWARCPVVNSSVPSGDFQNSTI